jgi:N-acetylglutamate synthase-like GNAT family acetyltransferase
MSAAALKIRRGRRGDFAAVMRLLVPHGAPDDRRTLRRFRHIVADLGADLYVAELGRRVVGVVHATYVRRLAGGQRGRIEDLAADPLYGEHQIERRLLEFILARAGRRACAALCCAPASERMATLVADVGLEPGANEHCRRLGGEV